MDYARHRRRPGRKLVSHWECCQCKEVLTYALYVACITCEHKRDSCCTFVGSPWDLRPISATGSTETLAERPTLTSTAPQKAQQHTKRPPTDDVILLAPTPSPFKRPGRLLDLPILIENCVHLAVPDTGTSINAISYAALSRLDSREVIALEDDSAKPESHKLGDGRLINPIGQIWLHCAFPEGNGEVSNLLFRVYDALAIGVSVIIGESFLKTSETLTKYTSRLKQRCLPLGHHLPRVMSLQPGKTYMRVYINSLMAYAYADTGSEVDLISSQYAARRGFEIHDITLDERRVAFADGEIRSLRGKVRIKFELPPRPETHWADLGDAGKDNAGLVEKMRQLKVDPGGPKEPTQPTDFYVLDGLDCDVLLGQALLDAIDAFESHQDAFVQMEDEEHKQRMCGIFKVGKLHDFLKRHGHGNTISSSAAASEDELYELIDKVDQCEIARRDKADAEIMQCKADHARESDSIRKAELIVRENQLIAANRDLCAQYEKEKADLRSAFQNANTVPTLPTFTANLGPGVGRDRPQAASSPKKRKQKRKQQWSRY